MQAVPDITMSYLEFGGYTAIVAFTALVLSSIFDRTLWRNRDEEDKD